MTPEGSQGFNKHLTDIIKHAATNLARSVGRGLAVQIVPKGSDVSGYYEAHMNRLAANFALIADMVSSVSSVSHVSHVSPNRIEA